MFFQIHFLNLLSGTPRTYNVPYVIGEISNPPIPTPRLREVICPGRKVKRVEEVSGGGGGSLRKF